GGALRTIVGGSAREPASLVPSASVDDWYWPGPPLAGGRCLQVPMAHIVRTGPGAWDFRVTGTSLARFTLPALELKSVTPVVVPNGVNMASAALRTQHFTYVYGTRDDGVDGKEALLARVRGRHLDAPGRIGPERAGAAIQTSPRRSRTACPTSSASF